MIARTRNGLLSRAPALAAFLTTLIGTPSLHREEVVTAGEAPIQCGSHVVGYTKRGEWLTVAETNGECLKVTAPGQSRQGWIMKKFVQDDQPAKAAPLAGRETERLLTEAKAIPELAQQV
jgi:hypothetical protein